MDSGHFALALEKYDITVHQPHPPGYFLYVMLGRILNLFIKDANTVFVSISIIFSALTIVAIYYLGKELYDEKTGFLAAAFALTSPNVWFHGEVALTYIVEAFFSTAVAFLCWRIYKGKHKYIWLSVVALSIAGGIRQNTMVFLLPLWLFSVKGVPLRKIIASLGLLGLVCLLWFVPMVWMTGGWNAYHEAFKELWLFNTGHVSVFEKGWASFKIFSLSLFRFTIYGAGFGMFTLVLAAYSLIRDGRLRTLDRTKVFFFSLWVLPSVFFYLMIFIHPANPGYILIFLPALFILTAVSIEYMSAEFKKILKRDFYFSIAFALIILNTFSFFLMKFPVSYEEIRTHDRDLSVMLASIKTFDPLKTAVFVRPYIYFSRQIMYYQPKYRVYQVDVRIVPNGEIRKTFWGVNRETFLTDDIDLPENINNLVIPLLSDDRDKVSRVKGISIKSLSTDIFIASGSVELIRKIYPELKVRLQDNNRDNKYEW
jgi:uncharacterized membrane protein